MAWIPAMASKGYIVIDEPPLDFHGAQEGPSIHGFDGASLHAASNVKQQAKRTRYAFFLLVRGLRAGSSGYMAWSSSAMSARSSMASTKSISLAP